MRMSVWDMDSEEEDMGSSEDENTNEIAKDVPVVEVADVEAKAEKETDEMVNKRTTFCNEMEARMSHF
jgi:hypothetical protein